MNEDTLERRRKARLMGEKAIEKSATIDTGNAEAMADDQVLTELHYSQDNPDSVADFDLIQGDTAAYKTYLQTLLAVPGRQADVLLARSEAAWYAAQYAEAERLKNRIGEHRQLTYSNLPDKPQRSTVEHALAQARATVDEITGSNQEWLNSMNAAIQAEQAAYDRVVTWGTWGAIIYVGGILLFISQGASLGVALAWPIIIGVILAVIGIVIAANNES